MLLVACPLTASKCAAFGVSRPLFALLFVEVLAFVVVGVFLVEILGVLLLALRDVLEEVGVASFSDLGVFSWLNFS